LDEVQHPTYLLTAQTVAPLNNGFGALLCHDVLRFTGHTVLISRVSDPLNDPVSFCFVHNLENTILAETSGSTATLRGPVVEHDRLIDLLKIFLCNRGSLLLSRGAVIYSENDNSELSRDVVVCDLALRGVCQGCGC